MTRARPLSPEFSDAVESARRALVESADGSIPRPLRRRIDAALGPRQRDARGHPTGVGYRRRVALERAEVERVLPIWEQHNPADKRPRRMIELADAIVEHKADAASAEREMLAYLDDVENAGNADLPAVTFAGAAAAKLVVTAQDDFDEEDLTSNLLDDNLDPDMYETDYLASSAEAYNEPRNKFRQDSDAVRRRRRDFWQWYLDEAVPAAYESVR